MVTHRISYFSYAFFFFFFSQLNVLASHSFFFTCQLNVLACHNFFSLANSTCWPVMIFFTSQLNVLAFLSIARWITSALVTHSPTCSGSTSWGADHWQQQETWRRPIPRACTHLRPRRCATMGDHGRIKACWISEWFICWIVCSLDEWQRGGPDRAKTLVVRKDQGK